MMLSEVTTVPDAALPVEEFKAHMRLGSGFGTDSVQDAVLVSFLRAAVTAVEARTSKVLFEREFLAGFSAWRACDAQALPMAPVSLISNVVLVDRAGTRTDVDVDAYWLDRYLLCPRWRSVFTQLPTGPHAGMAEGVLTAGYGPAWTDIPADLRQAVLLLAAHYYEYRDETALSEGCMPFGVASLIERYKVVRLYGGGAR